MPVIPIIGEPGMGKTTFLKSKIRTTAHQVITISYKNSFLSLPGEHYRDFNAFIQRTENKVNLLCAVDEAKSFVPKKEPEAWLDRKGVFHQNPIIPFLSGAREQNNMIYLVYHSWRDIYPWLIPYCTCIVRFNTQDNLTIHKTRFKDYPTIVSDLSHHKVLPKLKYSVIALRR